MIARITSMLLVMTMIILTEGDSSKQINIQITNHVKVLNIENLYIVTINENQGDNSLMMFVQNIIVSEQKIHIKQLNLQEMIDLKEIFDEDSRLKLLIKNQNPQAIISLTPIKILQLHQIESNDQWYFRPQFLIIKESQYYWFIRRSDKQDKLYYFLLDTTLIKNDKVVTINFEQRQITLYVQYDTMNKFILGKLSYDDCQSMLNSIDYELLRFLGFIQLKIDILLSQIQISINCQININFLVDIHVKELYQVNLNQITYSFLNFNEIIIDNAIFSNRLILLSAKSIRLSNIQVQKNPEIALLRCRFIRFDDLTIKENSEFYIDSDNTTIILQNIRFSAVQIANQFFMKIRANHLRIQLYNLSIKESILNNFILFNIHNIMIEAILVENWTLCIVVLKIQKIQKIGFFLALLYHHQIENWSCNLKNCYYKLSILKSYFYINYQYYEKNFQMLFASKLPLNDSLNCNSLNNLMKQSNKKNKVIMVQDGIQQNQNSVMSNVSFYPLSEITQIYNSYLSNVTMKMTYLILSRQIFIQGFILIDSQVRNSTLYLADLLNIQKIYYFNCYFENSYLALSQFDKPSEASNESSIFHNINLSHVIIASTGQTCLILIITRQSINIHNFYIQGLVNIPLFKLNANSLNIKILILNNITTNELQKPLMDITSNTLIIEQIDFNYTNIYFSQIMQIRSGQMTLTNSRFIDMVCYTILHINANELLIKNILLLDASRLTASQSRFFCVADYLNIENLNIQYLYKVQEFYFAIKSGFVKLMNVSVSGIRNDQSALLNILAQELIISFSSFIGVQNILRSSTVSVSDQYSRVQFINNYIRCEVQDIHNIIELFQFKQIYILGNQFEIMYGYKVTLIQISQSMMCEIIDNVIYKSQMIFDVLQINNRSKMLIKNLTLSSFQQPVDDKFTKEAMLIKNGYNYKYKSEIIMKDITVFKQSSIQLFSLVNPLIVILVQINIQAVTNSLIEIIHQDNITITFLNLTILRNNVSNKLIYINGAEYATILIQNLVLHQIQCSIKRDLNLISIRSKFKQIRIDNCAFINIISKIGIFNLENTLKSYLNTIHFSNLTFQNCQIPYLLKSNVPDIIIQQSIIFLNTGTKIIESQSGLIELSEIIYEAELANSDQNLNLLLTALTYPNKDLISQIQISFDNGRKFALNQQLDKNIFQALISKKSDYFSIPSGQLFCDFKILDIRGLRYQQYNITFLFISNKEKLTDCQLSIITNEVVNQNIQFDIFNQNWNNLMILQKPNTMIQFKTECRVTQHERQTILIFNARVMNCQIGEILIQDKCQPCSFRLQQYSVIKYSSKCFSIDKNSMEKVNGGLIHLKAGYWRPYFSNTQIEECQQINYCLGGFNFGNKLCGEGYLGAICQECDLFMTKSFQTYYKNQQGNCSQCNIGLSKIFSQLTSFIMQI